MFANSHGRDPIELGDGMGRVPFTQEFYPVRYAELHPRMQPGVRTLLGQVLGPARAAGEHAQLYPELSGDNIHALNGHWMHAMWKAGGDGWKLDDHFGLRGL